MTQYRLLKSGGPRASLDRCGKYAPTGIRSPDRSTLSQSLYRLSYLAHNNKLYIHLFQVVTYFSMSVNITPDIEGSRLLECDVLPSDVSG
jgi:hypothetical protein